MCLLFLVFVWFIVFSWSVLILACFSYYVFQDCRFSWEKNNVFQYAFNISFTVLEKVLCVIVFAYSFPLPVFNSVPWQ